MRKPDQFDRMAERISEDWWSSENIDIDTLIKKFARAPRRGDKRADKRGQDKMWAHCKAEGYLRSKRHDPA